MNTLMRPGFTSSGPAAGSDPHIGIWGSTDLLPTDREISWQAFDQVRQEASAAGFGGVIFLGCEDGAMDGAICVFRPEDLTIVATIDYPEARDEGDHPAFLSGADIRHGVTLEDAPQDSRRMRQLAMSVLGRSEDEISSVMAA